MNRPETELAARSGRGDTDWWRGAVIYQIYPRSFQDSNGDGIGDLAGITERLGHVASLDVDAIWISPFFRSPMLDFGYDVSDYRDVDPIFGTLADFDALLARAHDLGLRVLIDLVISHTSDRHDWFVESRRSRDNPKADWYVWADPRPDGTPPNNWLSIFGGSAWEWDGERMQYYMHNFLTSQPDLNFHNAQVQDAVLDVARFWLDRGVDGFRLDTANFYFHDAHLRDNPALDDVHRNDTLAPASNPYNFQDHRFDKNQPENLAFLTRLRTLMDRYPGSTTVGEIGDSQRATELKAEYTAGTDRLHMCYDFEFLSTHPPTGTFFAAILERTNRLLSDGWPCWAFSNHDVARHASRWNLPDEALPVFATLMMCLRGTACLYQGEELGLSEAEVAFEDLQDPYGKRFWPRFRGRDGCRTPMPWNDDGRNGGFSVGRPWLPVARDHLTRAVSVQDGAQGSVLDFYRRLLAWRRGRPMLARGDLTAIHGTEATLTFIRDGADGRLFCAFNLGGDEATVDLPDGDWTPDKGAPLAGAVEGNTVRLAAFAAHFALEPQG